MSIGLLREDVKRLAKLAANVSDAHTCAIFLPTGLISNSAPSPSQSSEQRASRNIKALSENTGQSDTIQLTKVLQGPGQMPLGSIEMVGSYSLSSNIARDCRIQVGHGLIGWVSENSRSIHVSPFDMDSSVLGIYSDSEPLKSLVAVPILIGSETDHSRSFCGVLMADSKKLLSFSKTQVKHLEEIATVISRLLHWTIFKREATSTESSWDSFVTKTTHLSDAIGQDSVEILRLTVHSFNDLESTYGITLAVQQSEQFVRLIQQALPPHFPLVRLPNGDLLIALDNMMSAFFQNKIRTLANHLNEHMKPFLIDLQSLSAKAGRGRGFDIDSILRVSASSSTSTMGKVVGGNRA